MCTGKQIKLARSVAEYAREIPLCDSETGRLIALRNSMRRLCRVLSALDDFPKGGINPWFRESIRDATNELVAHLEIAGALKESLEFACLNHRKKQESLLRFIRTVANEKTPTGQKALAKLKEWTAERESNTGFRED